MVELWIVARPRGATDALLRIEVGRLERERPMPGRAAQKRTPPTSPSVTPTFGASETSVPVESLKRFRLIGRTMDAAPPTNHPPAIDQVTRAEMPASIQVFAVRRASELPLAFARRTPRSLSTHGMISRRPFALTNRAGHSRRTVAVQRNSVVTVERSMLRGRLCLTPSASEGRNQRGRTERS